MPCKRPNYKTTCAVFAPAKVLKDLQQRYLVRTPGVIVGHVIVTAGTDGVLRVFYNNYVNA